MRTRSKLGFKDLGTLSVALEASWQDAINMLFPMEAAGRFAGRAADEHRPFIHLGLPQSMRREKSPEINELNWLSTAEMGKSAIAIHFAVIPIHRKVERESCDSGFVSWP